MYLFLYVDVVNMYEFFIMEGGGIILTAPPVKCVTAKIWFYILKCLT